MTILSFTSEDFLFLNCGSHLLCNCNGLHISVMKVEELHSKAGEIGVTLKRLNYYIQPSNNRVVVAT